MGLRRIGQVTLLDHRDPTLAEDGKDGAPAPARTAGALRVAHVATFKFIPEKPLTARAAGL